MASPSEAAPALVNLIIVINYSDTLERARVCGTRANMHVGAHTHTHTHRGRQGRAAGGRQLCRIAPPAPRQWNSVNAHVHGGKKRQYSQRPIRRLIYLVKCSQFHCVAAVEREWDCFFQEPPTNFIPKIKKIQTPHTSRITFPSARTFTVAPPHCLTFRHGVALHT